MKIKELLYEASQKLINSGIPDPSLEAEILIRHVLQIDRARIFQDLDNDLLNHQENAINSLIDKRQEGYPLSYITGNREFYGIELKISEGVLIPRQETELLVETAIKISEMIKGHQIRVADIGTGSGAIAVAVALNIDNSFVYACDISDIALKIADKNIKKYSLENKIQLCHGDLLDSLLTKVDIILSNPPYIPTNQIQDLSKEVLNEPKIALDGGMDGLVSITKLMKQAIDKLKPKGAMVIEISPELSERVIKLADKYFPESQISILKDLMGMNRAVLINKRLPEF